ncbi:MAG: YXWGXW repeat-containing protein, partial [Stellaceae bacterium]
MRAFRVALYLIAALAAVTVAPTMPSAQVGVSITLAPPPLPVYAQPVIPGPGYIWAPGYWAWGPDGYYWVPGTWVLPPAVGVLWTPGYWGWRGGSYLWNQGYWGPTVGFYGGINYGFGYGGFGYAGGYWNRGAFFYNRQVNNIGNNTNITNVYTRNVTNNITNSTVSYNGPGGATARMTAAQAAAARQPHIPPTAIQTQHREAAAKEP